jgi:hypothetical protein
MSASHPNPPPELSQHSRDTNLDDTQERLLHREELEALINFFMLLDTWDKQKKIA